MAAIDEIVDVQISVESATIDRAGFGTPLIAAFHNFFPEVVRSFASLTELTDAGVPSTHPIALAATSLLSQDFKPPIFKVGKRLSAPLDQWKLTPVNITQGFIYAFTVAVAGGVKTTISFTNGASETVATIVTALQALIDAVTDISASDDITHITVTMANAGDLLNLSGWPSPGLDVLNETPDPGLTTDLDVIETADPNWYGLLLDSNGSAEIEAAATWAEARIKLFGANSPDADVPTAVTTDLGSTLQTNTYKRTYPLFDKDNTLDYGGAAWMGSRFPTLPGSSTWKFKTLAGITTDNLTGGERSNLRNKSVNFYHRVAGVAITEEGVTPSGQFIDITRGIDWLQAEIQTNVFALLARLEKVPFTDSGADGVRNQILAALNQGIANQLLAADPAPTVTIPPVASINAVDKANRLLPDVEFTATLAGAIHKVVIRGKVTV